MFNLHPDHMIKVAIAFKSIDDWGKLIFINLITRAEL